MQTVSILGVCGVFFEILVSWRSSISGSCRGCGFGRESSCGFRLRGWDDSSPNLTFGFEYPWLVGAQFSLSCESVEGGSRERALVPRENSAWWQFR